MKLSGTKDARYRWLRLIGESNLRPLTRLLAHVLAMHGRTDGSNIFPSVRKSLAPETGLSTTSVTAHLDQLVRAGYLWRQERTPNAAWSTGFTYWLCVPKSLLSNKPAAWEGDPSWQPKLGISVEGALTLGRGDSVEDGSTQPVEGDSTPGHSVEGSSTHSSYAAELETEGVEAGEKVSNGVEQVSKIARPSVEGHAREVSKELRSSLRSKSSEEVSHESSTRVPSAKAARALNENPEKQKAIRDLLSKGFAPSDVALFTRSFNTTIDEVMRVVGSMQAQPGDAP